MHCVLCGGQTEPHLVNTDLALHGQRIWLLDVPADVCQSCGEPYFEMAIYEQMESEARAKLTL